MLEGFDSAWLKLSWAKLHSQALQSELAEFAVNAQLEGYIVCSRRYNANRHRIDVVVEKVKPLPVEWGLAVGDIANNYRSCLDHIAWAIVSRGASPPETLFDNKRRKIYFPIYDSRTRFNDPLRIKLPGARRTDIAVVRRFQPYHGGKRRPNRHAFAVLDHLSNADKHRTVQLTLVVPRSVEYAIQAEVDCTITRVPAMHTIRAELEVGTHLAPIYVRRIGPDPPS